MNSFTGIYFTKCKMWRHLKLSLTKLRIKWQYGFFFNMSCQMSQYMFMDICHFTHFSTRGGVAFHLVISYRVKLITVIVSLYYIGALMVNSPNGVGFKDNSMWKLLKKLGLEYFHTVLKIHDIVFKSFLTKQ